MDESVESLRELLTLDELTNRVGMSVRNIRFYTTKGLVPPPIRRGRSGYYSPDHVARLELVRELQGHGFTLSAIEKYLAGIPVDATPEDIALHRTMLAPWQADLPVEMSRAELDKRTGRSLSDEDLATLAALGIVFRTKRGRYEVALSQLSVGLGLLDLGFPTEAAVAAADVYAEHGRQIAKELNELFRTMVWPVYKESGASPERLREVVERLKPLSIASLVSAYEAAMDETRRENIVERTRRRPEE
jgi:DNA-binding transcriptional MerR regulator